MIQVGLVGLGFIGKSHLEAYGNIPDAQVSHICTRSGKAEADVSFSGEFISDYEDLLNYSEVDVVDICVPTYLHETYILKAAQAGKHIICEKPLSLTSESVRRIMQAVEEAGVQLFVGHVLRFWPAYQKIKETHDKKIANTNILTANRLGQVPTWSEWFQQPEKSGGALFDLHIHDIDFTYYLLGEVEKVYAVGKQNDFGAWNHLLSTLTFKNGATAVVEASHRMPSAYPFTMNFRVQGEDATTIDFQLKAGENIEAVNSSQLVLYKDSEIHKLSVEETDAFQNELQYFVTCISEKQRNEVIPLEDVLYVIELLEAIERSLKTGEIQHVK